MRGDIYSAAVMAGGMFSKFKEKAMATRKKTSKKTSKRPAKRSSKRSSRRLSPNYTPPKRGFVVESESGGDDLRAEVRREMIAKLAAEWNMLNAQIERRSFRSREEAEDEAEYLAEMASAYADDHLSERAAAEGVDVSNLPGDIYRWPEDAKKLHRSLEDEFYKHRKDSDVDSDLALRAEVVQEMISELGGRMMRPYEHWNEEESYREYAERDRDED